MTYEHYLDSSLYRPAAAFIIMMTTVALLTIHLWPLNIGSVRTNKLTNELTKQGIESGALTKSRINAYGVRAPCFYLAPSWVAIIHHDDNSS